MSNFKIRYLLKKEEMEAPSKKEEINSITLGSTQSSPRRGMIA